MWNFYDLRYVQIRRCLQHELLCYVEVYDRFWKVGSGYCFGDTQNRSQES